MLCFSSLRFFFLNITYRLLLLSSFYWNELYCCCCVCVFWLLFYVFSSYRICMCMCIFRRWVSGWNVNSHLRVVKAQRLKEVWININHRQVKRHSTAVHFRSGILSLLLSFFLSFFRSFFLRATDAWLGFQHRLFQLDSHKTSYLDICTHCRLLDKWHVFKSALKNI